MAKISSQSDHNYSLIVRNEPEVEVETVVETTVPFNTNEANIVQPLLNPDYHGSNVVGLLNNVNVEGTTTYNLSPTLANNEAQDVEKCLELVVSPNKSQNNTSFQAVQNVKSLGTYF